MDEGPAIHADDVSLNYPADRRGARGLAVRGVSLTVPRGTILGMVGEAGSGKSTIARAIAGLGGLPAHDSPHIVGGSLTVLGRPLRRIGTRARDRLQARIGYLPQDGGSRLDAHLTVGENVALPIYLRDRRFSRRQAGGIVATLIDAVHLPLGTMSLYPHELSQGQRQRVALARALVLEPELLVADDPTMGVDVLVRGAILDVLGELQRQREFSALIIAHEVGELRRIADRLAVLHRGMIVGYGPVDEVLARPHHPYVERLAQEYRHQHPDTPVLSTAPAKTR
ncbi:ABC-type dipeptide/oligopeptide/nickel transport system ATPase component [Diaminobutyricimonas aerilata]|uniref:ABC-type dipeptide/oligopeptide/nickel transport system ATPase component n=1 Tax=Diaminobutyricimonas aerilata TaxID=1162967 RepID=A0A2M9CJJ9_9MICO|nr:dipeptide/oligopeptide/nickel ABC transporter ATP-binding protein [Diaminobutyricimonas aerilata]PJJ72055.1 ABC-type dipeptide/oligopeptide/nickel transport system ATPase component [Diaminobutyricimonas aerilata]